MKNLPVLSWRILLTLIVCCAQVPAFGQAYANVRSNHMLGDDNKRSAWMDSPSYELRISGMVRDESGDPLPGVNNHKQAAH